MAEGSRVGSRSAFGASTDRSPSPPRGSDQYYTSGSEASPDYTRRAPLVIGAAPSSLARQTVERLSPSERAHADALRLKHRAAKFFVPGPGTYEPRRPQSSHRDLAGSTSFRSKTDRDKTPPSTPLNAQTSDPGAYEPNINQLASKSKESFQRSAKAGTAGFGSKSERSLKLEILGGDDHTPGPASYEMENFGSSNKSAMSSILERNNMPSSSFRSAGRIELSSQRKDTPGPGAYSVNDAATIIHEPGANPNNNGLSRLGRGFASGDVDRLAMNATAPITGPGSYESHREGSIST